MKTYILQKDLPNMKKGSEFEFNENIMLYVHYNSCYSYPPIVVENNPEWFKLKEEEQPLFRTQDGVDIFLGDKYYHVRSRFNVEHKESDSYDKALTGERTFHSEEKAEEFILFNKYFFSIADIVGLFDMNDQKINDLLTIVKRKRITEEQYP